MYRFIPRGSRRSRSFNPLGSSIDVMPAPQHHRVRRSFSSHASGRRYSAFHQRPQQEQGLEDGNNGARAAGSAAERNIEELEEIKRYEDFTTIDWVQDAAREQLRRRARRRANAGPNRRKGRWGVRQKIKELYDAGQAWIVVTLVGAAIGMNAAFLNIVTEWVSDIKRGHCTTAFYLNEKFCCWGAEECPHWVPWTTFLPLNYIAYILYSVLFAFTSACLVKAFAPYAAGSGISEIKCIIAGFVMKDFLGFWTLLIKSIALPLAIGSGLSVGKEGPSVHYAVCTGNVISRMFVKYKRNAAKTREILSACAAAGVAVAFGSPVGGVLFSLEEMSSYFPLKTLWRSYFCALVATAVLAGMNPFRTGQLVMFQVHYDKSWHFFELIFFVFIGVFGGLYGAFVIKWNLRMQGFRKKYLSQYAVLETVLLAAFTALLCFPNMFLSIDMTEEMEILFHECEGTDFHEVCEKGIRWRIIASLVYATIIRLFLVIISYGCKVPAGIFVPSMAIGASFGRVVGILVQALHETYPQARFFSGCGPDVECITPGTYAFLGAAAALSGIMHITVSVVVIMFELTGALTYILPTMIVVGVTKAVSSYFPPGGIADRMISFNGFPFLDTKEERTFNVPVSKTMTSASSITLLPASGTTLGGLKTLLENSDYSGFPVVTDTHSRILLGYVGRTELMYALAKAQSEKSAVPTAKCVFATSYGKGKGGLAQMASQTPSSLVPPVTFDSFENDSALSTPASSPTRATNSAQPSAGEPSPRTPGQTVDLSRFVDPSPLSVSPRLPLETAMEIFKKMGPRVILVEHRGRLVGLVTVKDCLKFQFQTEAHERGEEAQRRAERVEQGLWRLLQGAGGWVAECVGRWTMGRIKLSGSAGLWSDTGNLGTRSRGGGIGIRGWGSSRSGADLGEGTGSRARDSVSEGASEGADLMAGPYRSRDASNEMDVSERRILDGTEDAGEGVELAER